MIDALRQQRYGSGSGFGSGSGSGSGFGYGYGSGYGFGDGSGIKQINGLAVYEIDDTQTVIYHERGNVAKGAILRGDLTLEPCYIVTQDGRFAHGKTLRDAMSALRDKLFEDMPEDERIAAFVAAHEWGKEYPDSDYYEWHHRLTGSCEMGRMEFAKERGLEKLDGKRTVEDFIVLCKDSYGSEIIRKLPEAYGVALAYFGG